jgi:hypothetical protein
MSEEQQKRGIPLIEGAVDLVHLNPGQRLHLLGQRRFLERRTFLKNLLGASISCFRL